MKLQLTVRDHCVNIGKKAVSEMKLWIGNSWMTEYLSSWAQCEQITLCSAHQSLIYFKTECNGCSRLSAVFMWQARCAHTCSFMYGIEHFLHNCWDHPICWICNPILQHNKRGVSGGLGNWKKCIPLFIKINLPKPSRVSLTSIIRNWLISGTTHLHLALNFPKIQLFHYLKEIRTQTPVCL